MRDVPLTEGLGPTLLLLVAFGRAGVFRFYGALNFRKATRRQRGNGSSRALWTLWLRVRPELTILVLTLDSYVAVMDGHKRPVRVFEPPNQPRFGFSAAPDRLAACEAGSNVLGARIDKQELSHVSFLAGA